jgi:enamine deaminase RidA (YjgF/YER057c/UK114 family)
MTRSDVVKATFFLTRTGDLPAFGEARRRRWASDRPPAVTTIIVAALARPDALVEVEATAAATG